MNGCSLLFRKTYSNSGVVSQYFFAAALISLLSPLLSVVLGVSGFSLTPFVNAAFALFIFSILTVGIVRILVSKSSFGIPRESVFVVSSIFSIILMGSVIGFVSGNSKVYLLSAALYWTNWIGLIFCCSARFQKLDLYTALVPMSWMHSILGVAIATGIFGGEAKSQILLACVCFFSIQAISFDRYFYSVLFLLPLVIGAANTSRAMVLSFLLSTLVVAIISRRGAILTGILLVLILAYLSVASGVLLDILTPGTQIYRRAFELYSLINGYVSIENLVALKQRLYEMQAVELFLSDLGWLGIFGGGFGQTIDMSAAPDASVTNSALLGGGTVHNIHSLPHSLALRSGVLGLVLLCALVIQSLLSSFRIWKYGIKDEFTLFCTIYPIASISYALSASNYFLTDFIIGAMVVLAAVRTRKYAADRTIFSGSKQAQNS